jgi:N-acetyl-anhydromuramoyl-L-alanine amidase
MPWQLSAQGYMNGARQCASPNWDARPAGQAIDLLLIHYISLPPGRFGGEAIEALFQNRLDHRADPFYEHLRDVKVSSHFLIRRDGEVVQFVSTCARAWHAGASRFRDALGQWRERCNDFSIGVELEGDEQHRFTARQYRALTRLTKTLVKQHPLSAVTGHSDVAPGRKFDPGPQFDWDRFVKSIEGVGIGHRFQSETLVTP